MSEVHEALRTSVSRLRSVVQSLSDAQLEMAAYPSKWTIAHVLSHLGSTAVILSRPYEDALAGRETPPEFLQSVRDTWSAKSPREQASDSLEADRDFLDGLDGLSPEDRARFKFVMGPIALDFDSFVYFRLNEHLVHSWDIDVAFDPSATLSAHAVPFVVDNLDLAASYSGQSTASEHLVHVRTTDPRRDLAFSFGADGVAIGPCEPVDRPDLVLPAEALIRLVYGRLDPEHTPPVEGDSDLDELRRTFTGF